jgi:hypothetical protein
MGERQKTIIHWRDLAEFTAKSGRPVEKYQDEEEARDSSDNPLFDGFLKEDERAELTPKSDQTRLDNRPNRDRFLIVSKCSM